MTPSQPGSLPDLTIEKLMQQLDDPTTPLEVVLRALIPAIIPVFKGQLWVPEHQTAAVSLLLQFARGERSDNPRVILKAREHLARSLPILRLPKLSPILLDVVGFYAADAAHSQLPVRRDVENIHTFLTKCFVRHGDGLMGIGRPCNHWYGPDDLVLWAMVNARAFAPMREARSYTSCFAAAVRIIYTDVLLAFTQLPESPTPPEVTFPFTPDARSSRPGSIYLDSERVSILYGATRFQSGDLAWTREALDTAQHIMGYVRWEEKRLASLIAKGSMRDIAPFVFIPGVKPCYTRCNICHDSDQRGSHILHLTGCPAVTGQDWVAQRVFGEDIARSILKGERIPTYRDINQLALLNAYPDIEQRVVSERS